MENDLKKRNDAEFRAIKEMVEGMTLAERRMLGLADNLTRKEWTKEWSRWTKTASTDEIKAAQKENHKQNEEAIRQYREYVSK
jgi:hypothetical protein